MKILLINKMEVTVSDDRSWNQSFKESKEAYKKMHQENDKRIIEKHAKSIEKKENKNGDSKWTIVFDTIYGENIAIYFTDSGKWKASKGKAKGRGATSMVNYFKPKTTK